MSEAKERGGRRGMGLLTARIVFAAAVTAMFLYFMRGVYLEKRTGVKVGFLLRYENPAANHWQIFYRTDDKTRWTRLPSERMTGHATEVDVLLPVKTLTALRLDFGTVPGKVECRNFALVGRERVSFAGMTRSRTKQLERLELRADGLTCASQGSDPYIVFDLKRPLRSGTFYRFDVWSFLIPLSMIFLVVLALTRVVYLAKGERDGRFLVDGALVGLFVVALFVPMSGFDSREIAPKENRRLAKYRPFITEDGKINYRYGKEFDAWFNDHFRGRNLLLRLNAWWFSLNAWLEPQDCGIVYRGFDDWFFLAVNGALRNWHNLDRFDEATLAQAAADLNRIRDICGRQGKKFYVMIVPDKHKIYGEYFPAAPKLRPETQNRAEQFVRYMQKAAPEVPVMYLRDTLLKHKPDGLLYWKNDSHWNDFGAYLGYLELMKRIRGDFPEIPMCGILGMEMKRKKSTDPIGNDLAKFSRSLAKPDPTMYPVPRFAPKWTVRGDAIDKSFGAGVMLNPSGRKKVLILRDSFGISLLPYMGNSFAEITALWSRYLLPKNRLKSFRESDILIIECVEQFLPVMLARVRLTAANIEREGK